MAEILDFKVTKEPFGYDSLRIEKEHIEAKVNVLKFKDADTGQMVCYIPSLEISGYGENEEKAYEMVRFSAGQFLTYLNELSTKNKHKELLALGWKNDQLKHKEFSKAFVNGEGELQNLNAVEGKVERVTLQTA